VTILNDFLDMPRTMRQLAWAQFFSWFALFAMWIYTTAAVTSHLYGTTDTTSALYNEGANWVGVGFAAYNGVAAWSPSAFPSWHAEPAGRPPTPSPYLRGAGAPSISCSKTPASAGLTVGVIAYSILPCPTPSHGSLPSSWPLHGRLQFLHRDPQIVAAALLGFFVAWFSPARPSTLPSAVVASCRGAHASGGDQDDTEVDRH
jgi:maltose/moltooligosaccharide transporter